MLLKIKKCFKASSIHCYIYKNQSYELTHIPKANSHLYLYIDKIQYEEIIENISKASNISFYDYFSQILKKRSNKREKKKNIYYKVLYNNQILYVSKKYFYAIK